ncbi:cell wall-binding repeat-containing protein [Clostridium beijerinckii]|uniref:Cell wall-binding protein n=1 Tax=Clostridium beijerinckii TaxID=1520 RepID=A0A9Q5CY32_CLOBE|nr:cell wall-binding repeat-containing protein [Clostridium beijerinckii]AQS04095.1 N-acetylmuramoyl-L-alanine amidase LytC precursor [Clostridium beijerinckii]MBA2884020.1 putative cell wall-binding protein [Clostridium beijerinckii]MBA2899203.1 putative cell wall-binding protein [Clostridium beijerinckii]MBA2908605.1 putative cell wall-binding protein [Clostridium beijerinckii]MBA9016358.1 putative cell wall-binding protein [Clostridium beijerinckii]
MNDALKSCPFTLNTTRICADDELDTSIEISKIGFNNMKPNAVILVNKDEVFDGIAATSLVHFPINASLLFTDGNSLNEKTLGEIERLSPKGYNGVQVILVGNISKNVSFALNDHGYRTKHISGRNYYDTACIISRIRKEFNNILIISGEDYSEGIIAGYWSAHHGDPILFVQRNRIPNCTIDIIRKMNDINIYIIGSTKTISKDVEYYLSGLDNVKKVDRIGGENPYEIAVNFSRYNDTKTDFGWGRNYRGGHAFTFGQLNEPMKIIASVVFAHMGKHTPLLLIEKDKIPEVVNRYINLIKPIQPKGMPKPPFMHGFILGDVSNISYKAQKMIEGMLSIDQHIMNNENMEVMTGKMKDNVMNADKENMMMNNGVQDMNENIKHDSIYDKDYIFEWRNLGYRKVNVDEIL